MKLIEGEGVAVGDGRRFDPLASGTVFGIPAWLMRRVEVTMTAKLTYGVLTGLANPQTGVVTTQVYVIAEALGIRDAKVEHALNDLVKMGLLWETTDMQTNVSTYTFAKRPWADEEIVVAPDLTQEQMEQQRASGWIPLVMLAVVASLCLGRYTQPMKQVEPLAAVSYQTVPEILPARTTTPKLHHRVRARRTPRWNPTSHTEVEPVPVKQLLASKYEDPFNDDWHRGG